MPHTSAPHTLPEDRWSQEEATRQAGAALVLVTRVCACNGGRVAVKNHPHHPCAHTPHTHTHASVRTSVPTSKRKALKASGMENTTHGTPGQCPRGAASSSSQTPGQALSQVLNQGQEQNTGKLQRL